MRHQILYMTTKKYGKSFQISLKRIREIWVEPLDMKPAKSDITSKQLCGGLYCDNLFMHM